VAHRRETELAVGLNRDAKHDAGDVFEDRGKFFSACLEFLISPHSAHSLFAIAR
jgi:hypothetical protein